MIDFDLFRSVLKRRAVAFVLAVSGLASTGCSGDASHDDARGYVGRPPASPPASVPTSATQNPGTNVNLGGSQDTGFLRGQLEAGLVPTPAALDAAGFFAEHHIELPPPSCGSRLCVQPMLAVMGNLLDGQNCTLLHVGLNSPLVADPGARPPLSLAVVVDVSGSMSGQKIQLVREGLELLIDGMKDGDRLALITYSTSARVAAALGPVEDRRAELRSIAQGLIADGETNLALGLELGYREIAENYDESRQNRVILLSDGQPTAGVTGTAEILTASRSYNSDGIGLTTIGLGSDFNIDLMRGLAQQADGNFYFLEDVGAVNEVFREELSFFVVPIAFDLNLTVEAGPDYDFGRALGSPFWANTSRGGRLDVPSAFIAHRESDEDVTPDDGRRGGGSSLLLELMPRATTSEADEPVVAELALRFRDPQSNEIVEDTLSVSYPHPALTLESQGYFASQNLASIQKSFVMLNIFVGMERSIVDYHANRASSRTIAELDQLIAAVSDYNEEVQDKDIELDLALLDRLRVNLVRLGIRDDRVGVSRDPWPAD